MIRKYRRPYRIKKRKSIFRSRFFWVEIFILIIFVGIFYLIFFHSFFQIKNTQIFGTQKVSSEKLENLINKKINQKILFFSTKSIFFVKLSEIEKEILKNFPEIAEVNLKRRFPDFLILKIKERKPVAIFCQDKNCFFLDKEGIIFEFVEKRQDFPILKKEINKEINLGEKIIDKEKLSKILETEEKIRNGLKIPSEEFLVVSEERFNVKTLEGWQIYFSFKEDLTWQLTKLSAVLEKEISSEKRKKLEYIDLRFGNLAPYKYINTSND